MNGVFSSQYHGIGLRDEKPWLLPGMLSKLLCQQQRAFTQHKSAALGCVDLAPPLVAKRLREIAVEYQVRADPKVEFVDKGAKSDRRLARVRQTGSMHERAVDIGSDPATCSCESASIDKFPCACMVIVADKAGVDPCTLLSERHLTTTWQYQYATTPGYAVPSTELLDSADSLAASEQLCAPVELPLQPGRPTKKRIQGAIDAVSKHAAQAREESMRRQGLVS